MGRRAETRAWSTPGKEEQGLGAAPLACCWPCHWLRPTQRQDLGHLKVGLETQVNRSLGAQTEPGESRVTAHLSCIVLALLRLDFR